MSLVRIALVFFSRTAPNLIWKWTETCLSMRSQSACLVCTMVRLSTFKLIQMNCANRAITPDFNLTKPNLPYIVNMPIILFEREVSFWQVFQKEELTHCLINLKSSFWLSFPITSPGVSSVDSEYMFTVNTQRHSQQESAWKQTLRRIKPYFFYLMANYIFSAYHLYWLTYGRFYNHLMF